MSSIASDTLVHKVDDLDFEVFAAVAIGFGSGRHGFLLEVDRMIRCHYARSAGCAPGGTA